MPVTGPDVVRLAGHAMATRFEIILAGEDPARLRSIGEAALAEIRRYGNRFNFFDPASELTRLNRKAATGPVRLAPDLFDLLKRAAELHVRTLGAFDPSVGALMRAWGVSDPSMPLPDNATIQTALSDCGFEKVRLADGSLSFDSPELLLDLGGIAKGWAVDEAINLIASHGVTSCLLHGGTSSVGTIGTDPDGQPWQIALEDPYDPGDDPAWFSVVALANNSLSVSAVRGRSRVVGGVEYGHVVDPRNGRAVTGPVVSAVVCPKGAIGDAVSTALLVLDPDEAVQTLKSCGINTAARFRRTSAGWIVEAGSWPDDENPEPSSNGSRIFRPFYPRDPSTLS